MTRGANWFDVAMALVVRQGGKVELTPGEVQWVKEHYEFYWEVDQNGDTGLIEATRNNKEP